MNRYALSVMAGMLAVSLCDARATAGEEALCGDVDGNGAIVAFDALLVLHTAVGDLATPALICPDDSGGDGDERYVDNGDGTVTDNQTGLQWEKKTDDSGIHDKDNTYTWTAGTTTPGGGAFVEFLGTLDNCVEAGPFPPADLSGGFAGHCDWRLPSIVELQTIFDTTATDCGIGSPCIDPIFGPTINYNYWSATSFGDSPAFAWFADFDVGQVEEAEKTGAFHVRAVRTLPRHAPD